MENELRIAHCSFVSRLCLQLTMGEPCLRLFILLFLPTVISSDNCKYPDFNNRSIGSIRKLNITYSCDDPDNVTIVPPVGFEEGEHFRLVKSHSCISKIPWNICDFPNIVAMTISNTHINSIPSLSCLKDLVLLDLSHNRIETIRNNTFVGLGRLHTINLSYNRITSIHRHVFTDDLKQIRYVLLSHNMLRTSEAWPMSIKHEFCGFDLSNNVIERFTNEDNWTIDLAQEYEPGFVDYKHNNFTSWISDDLEHYGIRDLTALGKLIKWGFDFRDNPWRCDCKFHHFLKLASNFPQTILRIYFNVYCQSPPSFKGKLIIEIPLEKFVCNVTESCPSGCFCQDRPEHQQMLVDCEGAGLKKLPSHLPGGNLSLLFSGTSIKYLDSRPYLQRTSLMDLSGNGLVGVSPEAIQMIQGNISLLDISRNDLTYLPKLIQNIPFSKLVIEGNHFQCDCKNVWMSRWVRKHGQNSTNLVCYDKDKIAVPIVQADDDFLQCRLPSPFPRVMSALLGTLAVIFITVLILLVIFRYEALVTFHIISKKVHHSQRRNQTMEHDMFVSVDIDNDSDRVWVVKTLLPELENQHKLNLYVPFRDMDPGTVILEETINILKKCRTAIIILSNSCLDNSYKTSEFSEAYNILVRQRHGRLIIVRASDVTSSRQSYLNAFLRLKMCLDRSDPKLLDKIVHNVLKERDSSSSQRTRSDSEVTFTSV